VFGILGGNAYSSYQAATSSADATNYRTYAEQYSSLFVGSAIAAGLGLVGGGMLELGPSPASLKAEIQELDQKIGALSDAEAGQ
jgi:expansin (peptidoglycan-binding protein)